MSRPQWPDSHNSPSECPGTIHFCRRLLDLLIQNTATLSRLSFCCSSDLRMAKPSGEFFARACEIVGSDEVVFVDDRLVNVEAARRFGWRAIHANCRWLARFEQAYRESSKRAASALYGSCGFPNGSDAWPKT
jgi:hypothetical protein